ncbi:hypothetical protein BDZ89DRAFT_1061928 [Hymenopellis radicata]|nr:hypothetical protein BDZ89DRAFT_1061928 [Hymenopellis radicata]
MSTSDVSSITRGVEAMDVGKRERAREKLKKINETLTFEKMRAASPLDDLPYYYYPDNALKHYPPKWYLGIRVTIDDICNFARKNNLVATCPDPSSDNDRLNRRNAVLVVRNYLYETWRINAACSATIQFVYADTSPTHYICISICSNYNIHLCPDDALDKTEARLLELWDFTKPRLAWYLDALGDTGPAMAALDEEEKTEWPLEFHQWEMNRGEQEMSSV